MSPRKMMDNLREPLEALLQPDGTPDGTKEREYVRHRVVTSGERFFPESNPADKDAKKDQTSSVPPSSSHTLAGMLWDEKIRDHEKFRLLGIADPLASLVTLVWEASETTVDSHFLEHFVHRYFQQMRTFERKLNQRPGLQLVIIHKGENGENPGGREQDKKLKRRFYSITQQLLRKIGEAALDIQLRWIEYQNDPKSMATMILSAHQLTFKDFNPVGTVDDERLHAELSEFQEVLKKVKPAGDDENSPGSGNASELWERLSPLLEFNPGQLPLEPNIDLVKATSTSPALSRRSLLLSSSIRARRFCESPLWVDFSPVTLIASENASGKTTLVEALSQLYLGRARARALLPEHSHDFSDAEATDIDHSIQALRLTEDSQSTLPVGEFLPLFADDAELYRGRIGEVSLLSVLPILNRDTRKVLFETLETVERVADNLRDDALKILGARADAQNPDTVEISGKCLELWRKYLESEHARDDANSAKRRPVDPDSMTHQTANEAPPDRSGFDEPDSEEIKDSDSTESGNGAEKTDPFTALIRSLAAEPPLEVAFEPLTKILPLLLKWMSITSEPQWSILAPFTKFPSTWKALSEHAALRFEELAIRLEHRMQSYCRALELKIVPDAGDPDSHLAALENALYRYLDIGIELPPVTPDSRIRPNTARQVRRGFAARLARWLYASHGQLPILVVDEPVMGQDSSAAAAALGRFLRLRRIHEALSWSEWIHRVSQAAAASTKQSIAVVLDKFPNGVSDQPQVILSESPDYQPKLESKNDRWLAPLPPQVILASHLSATLVAAADSEGVILDLELQGLLRKLIPLSWMQSIRDTLVAVKNEFEEKTQDLELSWTPLTAAAVVRFRYELGERGFDALPQPLDPEKDKQWFTDAKEALENMGLDGLAHEVAPENAPDKTPEDPTRLPGSKHNDGKANPVDRTSVARRLLAWLINTDLLPAILADGQAGFEVSGVALRQLPAAGGEALELGPSRLRRIGAWLEFLPPDPRPVATKSERDESASASVLEPRQPKLLEPPELGVWCVQPSPIPEPATEALKDALEYAWRSAGMLPATAESANVAFHSEISTASPRENRLVSIRVGEREPRSLNLPEKMESDAPLSARIRSSSEVSLQLIRLRLEKVRPRVGTVDGEPLAIGLWTYLENEVAAEEICFSFGALAPTDASLTDQQRWLDRVVRGLDILKTALASSSRKYLRFYAKCHIGMAIRAGAIFNHRTGFQLEVMQNDSPWDLDLHKTLEHPQLKIDHITGVRQDSSSKELHVLVSFTQEVRAGYESWLEHAKELPRITLHIQPPQGPSRDSVPRLQVTDIAEAIVEELVRIRQPGDTLRFFVAMPNALAMALGRSLNALGSVKLMDWMKDDRRYEQTFELTA